MNQPAEPVELDDMGLEEVARQVARDARPLFLIAMAFIVEKALRVDEDEPAA